MVATLAQAASAAYYLESQRSFRHPNEYYTAGEEPDGVWFNPNGLFGLVDGGKVDSSDFHRLYNGFAPDSGGKLTRNAGSERRSAGLDMTFSADKSVSALWAIADPELRSEIEDAHNDAARVALEETVLRAAPIKATVCCAARYRRGSINRPIGLESSLSTTPNPAMAAPARYTCCSESGAKKKATSDHYWMVTVTRRFCGSRTPSGVGTSKLDSPTPRPDKRPVAQAPFSRASRTLVTRRSESF